jgi:hypothetical protein
MADRQGVHHADGGLSLRIGGYLDGGGGMSALASRRRFALVGALGLLAMAVLAPIAHFGVLETLIVPADPAATVDNIRASQPSFWFAIAALLIVAALDVLVAVALYVVTRRVSRRLALVVGSLRLIYATGFVIAIAGLVGAAQLVSGPGFDARQDQVMSSIAWFEDGWSLSLAIFGLHLGGLGALLFRSAGFPRFLGILVGIAGAGYLADALARIVAPDLGLGVSTFTFVGEVLLIGWLFWRAARGFPTSAGATRHLLEEPGVAVRIREVGV